MRIGIFSESYEPIINGVTICVRTLRDELSKQGHEVFIFAPRYPGFDDSYDKVFRFPSVRTVFAKDYPFPVPHSFSVKSEFTKLNLDIVHTQTPFLLGILGAKWAREQGIPVVSTNHTLYTQYSHYAPLIPKSLVEAVLITHMRRYYNGCDAVATPSAPSKDILLSYGVTTPIEVIMGGVNNGLTASPDGFRERNGIPSDARALLYVGRLAVEKNLDMLLSAFQLISKQSQDTVLVVVGGGPYEQELKNKVEASKARDRIILVGPLPPEEVKPAYAATDLFLWPSVTETQGLAVCEALSAGLPCVAVRAGGTPECVEEGADSLLTGNDPVEFAESALRLLSDDDLRRRMAEKALANSVRFSTSEMASRFVEWYESVIRQRQ